MLNKVDTVPASWSEQRLTLKLRNAGCCGGMYLGACLILDGQKKLGFQGKWDLSRDFK